ncbi:S9 family peptidase [Bacillus spongiae]|uniref:S9 family peptidase n=1 Tax=Bacillus spongiae TaxID=2683610 RepID=A0ABU8H8M7_9BACI
MLNFAKPEVEQFFQTYGIETFAVSPDETQLVYSTNISGKYNLWAMDLPRTFPYPLTFHNQSCQKLIYDKNGHFIVTVSDHNGDENGQIYAIPPQGGHLKEVRKVTGAKHEHPFLSKNGKRLYYTSNKDDETFMKGYVYDLETGKEDIVIHGQDAFTIMFDISPEENSFLILKFFSNTYTLAYAKCNNEEILLTPDKEVQHTVSEAVYVSETEIYLLTNYDSDFSYLAKFDLKSKEFHKVLSIEKEDFAQMNYDKTTQMLYLVSKKGVHDNLYTYEITSDRLEKIHTPVSIIDQFVIARSGNIYVQGSSSTSPMNIYKKTSEGWNSLTNYGVPGVKREEMVEPEVVTYQSFDDLPIEALLFRPKPENDNGHVILFPHGGPQKAVRISFSSLISFLVYRGYSIFAPNFRGSPGYGSEFKKMVEGDWGYGPRLDNIKGLEWLIERGYASRDRVFLMGGSYGGYMSLLLHGRHSEYFKAVVDIFGPSNLFSFIHSVPDHWKPVMKQLIGDPVKDQEKMKEDSPITYLEEMTKPMLIIQGAQDSRVVKAESDQIVEALRKINRDVDYIVLENEGHGFSKKSNEIHVYRKVLEFFDRYL